jgi:hypothetical protein
MSTFKCGLRRFDGHGTSSYRPTNTAATKEMESAFSRMMREREAQDKGCFGCQEPVTLSVLKGTPVKQTQEPIQELKGDCYSLSDATPIKKTE